MSCILRFVLLLQDDINVYRSSPPLPEITRLEHLLPCAHKAHVHQPGGDSDNADAVADSEFDESFSSADIGEAGAGGGDKSPSSQGDLGASHPTAPRMALYKRKTATSSGEAKYVL